MFNLNFNSSKGGYKSFRTETSNQSYENYRNYSLGNKNNLDYNNRQNIFNRSFAKGVLTPKYYPQNNNYTQNNFMKNSYDNSSSVNNFRKSKSFHNLNKFLENPPFDINHIINSGSIKITEIEKNLDCLLYGEINNDNEDFEKLIKNFQQISEYYLTIQNNLQSDYNELEKNQKNLLIECNYLENELKSNKDIIHNKKTISKSLQNKLNLYKTIIDENSNNLSLKNELNFFCNYGNCSSRKFSNYEKLSEHNKRRHKNNLTTNNVTKILNTNSRIIDNNKSENKIENELNNLNVVDDLIDTKMSKLKDELTYSLSNFFKENLNSLLENQNHLEKKIEEIKIEKNNENNNQLKNLIEEIKIINIQNIQNLKESKNNENNKNEENDNKYKENNFNQLQIIQTETKKIHEFIENINKSQNDKILNITEQLGKFQEIIISELKEIKETKKIKINEQSINKKMEINIEQNSEMEIKTNQNITPKFQSENKSENKSTTIPLNSNRSEIIQNKSSNTSSNFNLINPDRPIEVPIILQSEFSDKKEDYQSPETKPAFESEQTHNTHPNIITNQNFTKSDYLDKMKNIFNQFITREETQLFIENNININSKKSIYSSIPEVEIVVKNDYKIKEYLNQNLNKILKISNSKIDDFNSEKSDWKTIANLIGKISQNSFEKLKQDDYYKDYMENIYRLFDIKKLLSDEKILSKEKMEEIFKIPEGKVINTVSNVLSDKVKNLIKSEAKNISSKNLEKSSANILTITNINKQSIETVQTGQFNEINIVDDFDNWEDDE